MIGFWVFQCKNCGKWCVKEIRGSVKQAMFNCKFCNRTYKIKKTGEFGLQLNNKGPMTAGEASVKCSQLNGGDKSGEVQTTFGKN